MSLIMRVDRTVCLGTFLSSAFRLFGDEVGVARCTAWLEVFVLGGFPESEFEDGVGPGDESWMNRRGTSDEPGRMGCPSPIR
jgi:hypothetical protein